MSVGSNSPPLDPALLAAFREQGAAIVARERGLSPACRLKLAGVARGLGIADDQIEQAIRSLAVAEPAAPPNPQVERFRQRLHKDLSGKSRTIIGPTIEARILSAARRKYGLEAELASQVLGEVAAELGLTRITASDAIKSLAAQIDHAAGDSTWLAREAWDRLRSAGVKWGLELEVIDELIDERLAANRSEYSRRSFATRATLYLAGGGVIVAALVIAGLLLARSARDEAAPSPGTTAQIAPRQPSPKTPAWWDVDLSVEMVHAKTAFAGRGGIYEMIASSSASQRADGYERLLAEVAAAPQQRERATAASRIIAGCYALESDGGAAQRLAKGLLALLPATDAPLPDASAGYAAAFWAADTAATALDRRGAKNERRIALADSLGVALGAVIDPAAPSADRRRLLREHTALAAYRQLAAAATKQPSHVAALYPAVAERAAAILPDEEVLRSETALLAAVLPAVGSDWKVFERPIMRCIAAPDPLPALRLTDALRRVDEPELAAYLSELLIVRCGARPKSLAKKEVIAAVRAALGGGASLTAADRWLALRDEAQAALVSPAAGNEAQLLDQIVELAHLTILAIALAQGEAGFATFDARLNQPPESVAKHDATPEARSAASSGSSRSRPLAKGRQRDLVRSIDQLGGRGAQIERESALRTLVGLAGEAADVTPQQAAQIAAYILADKRPEDQDKVVAALGELRRWKRLRLAIADAFPNSKFALGQQQEIAALVAGRSSTSAGSAHEMRRLVIADVLHELESEAGDSSTAAGDMLDKAAESLAAIYGQSAALLGAAQPADVTSASPSHSLEAVLRALADATRGRPPANGSSVSLEHELKAEQYLAGDDLRLAAALTRMLVELSARRVAAQRPAQSAAARQIAAQSASAYTAAGSVLVQLRDQEAALLKLWMMYAPDA